MFNQLIHSKNLLLLREAFASLLPIVLVMNFLILLSGLTELLESWGITGASTLNGDGISRLYYFLIPLFLNLSLSTLLAKEKELDQIGTLLIAMVCFFRVSGFLSINSDAQLVSVHGSILTSLPSAWVAVHLLHYFSNCAYLPLRPSSHLPSGQNLSKESNPKRFILHPAQTLWRGFRFQPQALNPRLQQTLSLLIPGVLTVLCFEVANQLFKALGAHLGPFLIQGLPQFQSLSAVQELILYKTISLLTWFLGIHGEHSADGLFRFFKDIPPGEVSSLSLKTFHDVFMNIGGSGSTLVVSFLLLRLKQAHPLKAIAQLSLPFSLFNVNEILLFGLPIILNPIFFIPFFMAPFVNMLIALSAIHLGVFAIAPTPIHWMTPPLYSAFISSDGSIWAVFTQMVCIVVDGIIYLPFLRFAGRQFQTPLSLLKLFGDDAYGLVNEAIRFQEERLFVTQQMGALKTMNSAQRILHQLRGGQFLLYFQPKLSAHSGVLVGMEALIRFRDATGGILSPSFLSVLYAHGLSKVVDKKVINLVFEQVQQWQSMELQIPPISINLDKDFLLDPQTVQTFIRRAKEQEISFDLEITEHTYTVQMQKLASVIQQLRMAGHRISIDDFGSGYSSLTSLLDLDADEIKLDRRFVAPYREQQRGQILLASSVQLCHDLGFVVVAEGVETLEQLELVQRCGVDVVQGYYTGKPMNAEHMSHLFQDSPEHPVR